MQIPLTSHRQGHCGKTRFNQILPQATPKNQLSRISELSNYSPIPKVNLCPHCGFEFRLNVVSERSTRLKYLRSGCCDVALRKCPKCQCELVAEVRSIDGSRVKLLCAGCLKTLAIAVKPESIKGGAE